MAFRNDSTNIAEFDSRKGMDGCSSIADIKEQHCEYMENCDLSTPGVIQKRGGYGAWAGALPVRFSQSLDSNYRVDLFPKGTGTVTFYEFVDGGAGLAILDKIARQTVRDLPDTYVICVSTTPIDETTYIMLAGNLTFCRPCFVFDQYTFLIGRQDYDNSQTLGTLPVWGSGTWSASSYAIATFVGPLCNKITQDYADSITYGSTPPYGNSLIVTTSKVLPIGDVAQAWCPLVGACIYRKVSDTVYHLNVLAGVAFSAGPVDHEYFNFSYSHTITYIGGLGYYLMGLWALSATVNAFYNNASAGQFVDETSITISTAAGAATYFAYGSGFRTGPVSGLESFQGLSVDQPLLVAATGGDVFSEKLKDYANLGKGAVSYIPRPPVIGADQTVSKNISGYFVINFTDADDWYEEDDIIYITKQTDSQGTLLTYELTVIAASATTLTLAHATLTTLQVYAGQILDFTRTSDVFKAYAYTGIANTHYPQWDLFTETGFVSSGSSIRFVDYDSEDVWHTVRNVVPTDATHQYATVYLTAVATYRSGEYVQAGSIWKPYNLPIQVQAQPPYTSPLASRDSAVSYTKIRTAVFNSSTYLATENDGMYRTIDGDELQSLSVLKPIVFSIRSIPGTKGVYPVELGSFNEKIGKEVRYVLTFSFTDIYGRTTESTPTGVDENVFRPKACVDGSDYAEIVEMSVFWPPKLYGLRIDAINIYRENSEASDATLNYLLEKSVPTTIVNFNTAQPGAYNQITFRLGDNTPENSSSKSLYSLVSGKNVPAPRAKYIRTFANRLVSLNEKSYPYFTFTADKVFNVGTGVASPTYALGFDLVFTAAGPANFRYSKSGQKFRFYPVPVGVENGVIATFNVPGASVNGTIHYIDTVSATAALPLNGGPTITYADTSHRFDITHVAASALYGLAAKIKLRCISTAKLPALSIDLLGDMFEVAVLSATATHNLAANTKWLDSAINASGVPTSLTGYKFISLIHQATVLASQVKNYSVFIGTSPGNADGAVWLYSETDNTYAAATLDAISNTVWTAISTTGYALVIHGLGTLGGIRESNSTKILNWESDLTFKVVGTGTTDFTDDGGVKRYYRILKLTPIRLTHTAAGYPTEDTNYKTTIQNSVGRKDNVAGFSIFLYPLGAAVGTTDQYVISSISGFSTPVNKITVNYVGVGVALAGMTYVNLNLNAADEQKLPSGVPYLRGALRIATLNANSVDLEVLPNFNLFKATTGFSLAPTVGSYLLKVQSIVSIGGGLLSFRINSGTPLSTSLDSFDGFVFIHLRGIDFNSTSFKYSGWFRVVSATSGGTVLNVSLPPDFPSTLDYSEITGLEYSYVISIPAQVSPTYYNVPIPVPYRLGYAESLSDIALPLFTTNPDNVNLPLVQVTKRLACAINSVLGERAQCFIENFTELNLETPPNGFLAICPGMQYNYRVNYSTELTTVPQDLINLTYWAAENSSHMQISAWNPTTGNISTSQATNLTYRVDEWPTFIRWSYPIANSRSGEIPLFKAGSYYDFGTQEDSEILGANVFKNALYIHGKQTIRKLVFGETINDFAVQQLQTKVGSYSNENIPSNDRLFFFVNRTGVYQCDGETVDPVNIITRQWKENVIKNDTLLRRTAGYTDSENLNVQIGVPFESIYTTAIAQVDGQLMYCYDPDILGWTCNTHIDATCWAVKDSAYYFGSTRGFVFRMRSTESLVRYRDADQPIPMVYRTKFMNTAEAERFKFWRNVILQLGADSDINYQVYYSQDFKPALVPFQVYPVTGSETVVGQKIFGNDRVVKQWRETLAKRLVQISITVYEATLDTPAPVYRLALEGYLANTRLIPQKDTRSNGR